jgi:outer membrane protein assembly factor BamA
VLTVHLDEGLPYRLGDVRFRSSDPTAPLVFSNEELRKLIQLREGDLFSVEKIREALDAMKELYGSHGYIDFVVSPLTDIDDEPARVSLVMEVDQLKQSRVGKIEVFGLNPAREEPTEVEAEAGRHLQQRRDSELPQRPQVVSAKRALIGGRRIPPQRKRWQG